MNRYDLELGRLKKRADEVLKLYLAGMDLLQQSQIFTFLKEKGRVNPNQKDIQLEAMRSAGYNECLDDLYLFKEYYLQIPLTTGEVPKDYGGFNLAKERGDLTKEEIDALKSGKPIQYPGTKPAVPTAPATPNNTKG